MIVMGVYSTTLQKTFPSATSSTLNATWTGSGPYPDLCDERLVNNCLSHGIANKTYDEM